MLTCPIDAEVEAARGEFKELENTIKDWEKSIVGLENLLSEPCVEVTKYRAVPASFTFYTGLSVESFNMFFIWWEMQLPL